MLDSLVGSREGIDLGDQKMEGRNDSECYLEVALAYVGGGQLKIHLGGMVHLAQLPDNHHHPVNRTHIT